MLCVIMVWCRDGRQLVDGEIVGMLIGLLMAGQHTSSTTSAWLGFYLARNKHMQVRGEAGRGWEGRGGARGKGRL